MSPRISASQRDQYLQNRRDQIIDAAIQVFANKGFAGANVADIAAAIGVSKGTIYLYFKSKEDIFTTILTERSFIPYLSGLVEEDQPAEDAFRHVAETYFAYMDRNLPLFRLVISDAFHFPELAHQVYTTIILKGNQVLAGYLNQLSAAGRIRPLADPFLTARFLMGMLMTYTLSQEIFGGKDITPIARQDWINEMERIFVESVGPL